LLKRRSCLIPCQCSWRKECLTGVIVDLSFDRALVARLSVIPPLGTRVTVQLGQKAEQITVTGQTVYVQEAPRGLFGIEFLGNSEKNLEKLKHALPLSSEPKLDSSDIETSSKREQESI
jgi:hypothetical protein